MNNFLSTKLWKKKKITQCYEQGISGLKQGVWHASFQLDVVGHIDSLTILLSPRQVHLLVDLFGAFSGGGEHFSFDR